MLAYIKNYVFDIGRVLLEYEPLKYLNSLYDEGKARILFENIFLSKEWVDLDLGIISKDEAIILMSSKVKDMDEEISFVLDSWYKSMIPIESTVKIKEKIKEEGKRIYILSNMNEVVFENLREMNGFLKDVDGFVVSGYENIVKPDEKIYNILTRRYNLNPYESLFIDDTKENVDAAIKLGYKAVVYNGEDKLKKDIKKYLDIKL